MEQAFLSGCIAHSISLILAWVLSINIKYFIIIKKNGCIMFNIV